MNNRLGLVVGALIAVLVALTGVAVYSLVLLGSLVLAVVVVIAGIAAVLAVGAAYVTAREVEAQLPQRPEVAELPAGARQRPRAPPRPTGFRVREARPGEIPAAYLTAVMKGAQATHEALKARDRQP